MNPNGSGGGGAGSNGGGGGNGHGHGHVSGRAFGGGGGNALWLRPIHNLLQHHQHQHCHLSNGGQHSGGGGAGEELEMKSLAVRRGSTNAGGGGEGRNVGALLGKLNGGMNYPTILPSFVCSYSSKTPPPHSQQRHASPEQRHGGQSASEHTETLNKLYQLMGQHSKSHTGSYWMENMADLALCLQPSRALRL